ncbi:helix-turn-helix domain-containing protein [Natrialba asiatica]|uniref:Transcriptional regulator TrmB n=1 Tax=Natrialba asiatica (strain ATCC 700177 / DSM 12278 / JCM 9576 / FERM P-10747 / NBRC 102637 / 172P1) TaxID=29540 RepID=M0AXK2_NATA1|nr:helix-turn-helix domain-containing protein [Natrialba asiatica]ELZ03421.1 transcriptional regulator TrmB [Natrialba asiatica DSM 12278]
MPDAVQKQLQNEREWEDLLDCIFGLNKLDRGVFRLLAESSEPLTVDHIAEFIEKERTTAYRSVKRLEEAGVAVQEQESCPKGGYHHVYRASDPDEIADELQRMLNQWYAETGQLIQEFRDAYAEDHSPETSQ